MLLLNASQKALISLLRAWIVNGSMIRSLTLNSRTNCLFAARSFQSFGCHRHGRRKTGWWTQAHKEKDQRFFLLNHWERSCINWWQRFFQATVMTWVQSGSYFLPFILELLNEGDQQGTEQHNLLVGKVLSLTVVISNWVWNLLFQTQFSSVIGSY